MGGRETEKGTQSAAFCRLQHVLIPLLQERHARNGVREPIDPRRFAKEALERIKQKLQGMYVKDNNPNERRDKEIATNNLVQLLIEEAIDLRNLAKMYPGWAPWH